MMVLLRGKIMYSGDFYLATEHPILQKHTELLRRLNDDRVMCVCYGNKEFYIEEQCDEWYSHTLTKAECIELSELFREIANRL